MGDGGLLSPTRPLLGSTTPRIYTPPLVTGPPGPCGCGCALTPITSWGFSVTDFALDPIGVELIPWQRWVMIHTLELTPAGKPRYRTVLLLVARQNGKTSVIEFKNLWKMFVLQVALVIGTAQDLDTSEESWDKAVEICEAIPELAAEIKQVDKTNGKKALKLVNGARWKIAAASRRGGRGKSGDDVNLDELREHQSWDSWGAVTKTTMARPDAQIFAFSNAGDDRSVVLNSLQRKGRAAAADPANADPTLGFFEWSVPDDVKCTCQRPGGLHAEGCRLADRRLWAMANPALGYTISQDSLRSALNTDPEEIFRTECLCQRVPSLAPDWAVIGEPEWTAIGAAPPDQQLMLPIAIAIDVTPERSHTSIAVVGEVGGLLYVEITAHRRGTQWVVPWMEERVPRLRPVRIVIVKNSQAGSLIKPLEKALNPPGQLEWEITTPAAADEAQACGAFVDAAAPPPESGAAPTLRHLDQLVLNEAVRGAVPVSFGDGAWRWSRKNSLVVISPLVAATNALWGYETRPRDAKPPPATAPVPPPSAAGERELFRPSGRLQL